MKIWILLSICVFSYNGFSDEIASKLVENAENQSRGKTFTGELEMVVDHSGQQRTLKMKIWTEGMNKATVKITSPAREKDTGNLRIDLNLWQYAPHVDRILKIPSSMMLQSWMGSDFTNDDLVKTSSLARDYTHKKLLSETILGKEADKIECLPKPSAPVVWGKIVVWITKKEKAFVKQEFYDEKNKLVKMMEGSEIQKFGSHTIPTQIVMTNFSRKDSRTTLKYKKIKFDESLSESFFTQEFLRRPVAM